MTQVALYRDLADVPPGLTAIWQPHPGPQTDFLARQEFEAAYGGAKGGGKTDALLYGALDQIQHPRYHAAIFRRSYTELQEIMDRAGLHFRELGGVWNEQKKRWTFPSGARLSFFYCQRVGDERKHNGKEYQYLGFDQLEEFTEDQYTFLIGCCRTSVPGLTVRVRASFNPGGPGHLFCKRRFYDLGPGITHFDAVTGLSRVFIPARVWDNPAILLNDPGYVQRLMGIADPALRRAYLEGDMDVFAGQYFAEWRTSVHVVEVPDQRPLPPSWPRAAGLDWGYSPHPGILLLGATDPFGRRWYYRELEYRELAGDALGDAIADQLREPCEREIPIRADTQMWTTDPAKAQSIAHDVNRQLRRRGCAATLLKAKKDRRNGWARVHQYLDPRRPDPRDRTRRSPWAFVYRGNPATGDGCPYLISTLPAQVHDERGTGDLRKSSTDHACDALRYDLMGHPMLPTLPVARGSFPTHRAEIRQHVRERLLEALEGDPSATELGTEVRLGRRVPAFADELTPDLTALEAGVGQDDDLMADVYGA